MATEDLSGIGGAGSGGITGPGGVGGGVSLIDVANAEIVEYVVLNLTQITNKEITLTSTPHSGSKTRVSVIEGIAADYLVDYTIAGDKLQWTALAFDGQLAIGDKLRITYRIS